MSKFIVVQFNDYNTIENCYEFFSENAAAKYAL